MLCFRFWRVGEHIDGLTLNARLLELLPNLFGAIYHKVIAISDIGSA